MVVMKTVHITHRAGLEPTPLAFRASVFTITSPRLPHAITLSKPPFHVAQGLKGQCTLLHVDMMGVYRLLQSMIGEEIGLEADRSFRSHYTHRMAYTAYIHNYNKTFLTDHLHRSTTPLYQPFYLGPKRSPIK